jgi:hypothetical protein
VALPFIVVKVLLIHIENVQGKFPSENHKYDKQTKLHLAE